MKRVTVISEIELAKLRADNARLDTLEALPYGLSLMLHNREVKSEDAPSLRSQIDYFLEQIK